MSNSKEIDSESRITIDHLAKYLSTLNVVRDEQKAKFAINDMFSKIKRLVIEEGREVYILGLGTFYPRHNDYKGHKTVTLAFRRSKCHLTRRSIKDEEN